MAVAQLLLVTSVLLLKISVPSHAHPPYLEKNPQPHQLLAEAAKIIAADSVPWTGESRVKNVWCPDGEECADRQTCCLMGSTYGCCPYALANCCYDGKHCCPLGQFCVNSGGKHYCESVSEGLPQVICPDEHSECPNGNTCCKNEQNNYGCCPAKNAVCCTDGVHCCPEGYKCYVFGCVPAQTALHPLKNFISLTSSVGPKQPSDQRNTV